MVCLFKGSNKFIGFNLLCNVVYKLILIDPIIDLTATSH